MVDFPVTFDTITVLLSRETYDLLHRNFKIITLKTHTTDSETASSSFSTVRIVGLGTGKVGVEDCSIQLTTRSLFGCPCLRPMNHWMNVLAFSGLPSVCRISRIDLACDYDSGYPLEDIFSSCSYKNLEPFVKNGKRLPVFRNTTSYVKIYDKGADRLRHGESPLFGVFRLEMSLNSRALSQKGLFGRKITVSDILDQEAIYDLMESAFNKMISNFRINAPRVPTELLTPAEYDFWLLYKMDPSLARDGHSKSSFYRLKRALNDKGFWSASERPHFWPMLEFTPADYLSEVHEYKIDTGGSCLSCNYS